MFLEISEIQVTHVANDAVYDFVIAVTIGGNEIAEIAAELRALVER